MTFVYAVVNQKGGVGKTTTAVNLSAALRQRGESVLLVDLDPQGNATSGLGVDNNSLPLCLYDCLVHSTDAADVRIEVGSNGLHLLPSNIKLADAEIEMVALMSRETRLRQMLGAIRHDYSYVLIDCPPSMGLLTINGLVAADAAIIPMQCEYYALEGISRLLLKVIQPVQVQLNPGLEIGGVLFTMVDPRMRLTEQVMQEVKNHFGEKVYRTVIPRNVRLSEAPSHGKSVLEYDPRCRGAEAYVNLAEEVIERGTQSPGPRT
ncbi:MAG: ParA family protein [Chloroflexi bacterium]|nr:ParA family protein [Chloroflexota bacterium]